MLEICIINTVDANPLGPKEGEKMKVVSVTNPEGLGYEERYHKPMVGKVKITETIRPGVITFTLGHVTLVHRQREKEG